MAQVEGSGTAPTVASIVSCMVSDPPPVRLRVPIVTEVVVNPSHRSI